MPTRSKPSPRARRFTSAASWWASICAGVSVMSSGQAFADAGPFVFERYPGHRRLELVGAHRVDLVDERVDLRYEHDHPPLVPRRGQVRLQPVEGLAVAHLVRREIVLPHDAQGPPHHSRVLVSGERLEVNRL